MAVIPLAEPKPKPASPPRGCAVLALGFRPFYLLAAILALTLVPLWILLLSGALSLDPGVSPLLWHAHEMIFGFAAAVIVGFLFTAGRNWTGLATPSGLPLALLVLVWIIGRIAPFTLPPLPAVLVDLIFLPLAAVSLARVLLAARSRRNYFLPALLMGLTLANLLTHAGAQGWWGVPQLLGPHLAIALIATLCTVIAGRIVPSFTANALKTTPWRNTIVDRIAIGTTLAALVSWALGGSGLPIALLALVAAVLQGVRSNGWRPWATLRIPLLWILHLSHGWLIVALLLVALAAAGFAPATAAVVHLLTVGLVTGLILAMITRTTLGHTGRLLRAGRIEIICYLLLQAALLLRVLPQFILPQAYLAGLQAAAALWALCFALYLWKYAPMLWRPRGDGQAG